MKLLPFCCLVLSMLPCIVKAQEQSDECATQPVQDYNMPLRVGSLFIILVTSGIGIFAPIILHRINSYSEGGPRDWILTIAKFFGTGVILATAFVHMLPDALDQFSSPCLSEGWQSYGAFSGVFCMLASFALQLLELAAVSRLDSMRQAAAAREDSDAKTKVDHDEEAGCHVHGAGFLEEENAFKSVGTLILELGIVMHSILIGITLANTGNDGFVTLLIALVFHQFFEGLALGTRINDMNHKSWVKPIILGLLFIIMTPIGIAIGIGIHSSFNENSPSSVLASAILDSLSAGILLYNAYTTLMSVEINQSIKFRRSSFIRKVVCFLSMYAGAGLMALLGKWA